VAFPIGGPNRTGYLILEVHYDNPHLHTGNYYRFNKTISDKLMGNFSVVDTIKAEQKRQLLILMHAIF